MTKEHDKKYFAFISYSHRDEKIARWLQRKLESYKLPSEIHNDLDSSRYLRPVFRDRSDLDGGVLTDVLREKLQNSKYLIVICSPNSASSQWVSNEVKAFVEWGRLSQIIPLIIDGEIGGDDRECLPTYLREHTQKNPDDELLAIDIRENGRHKALIRVVSYMLGVAFDSLWQRYQRERRRKIIGSTILSAVIAILIYWFAVPITVSIGFTDAECNLPQMRDAKLSIDGIEYLIVDSDTVINHTLPGYWRLKNVPITFEATYYFKTELVQQLGAGIANQVDVKICRDKSFALFAGIVIDVDGNPLEGVNVNVDNKFTGVTDNNGKFYIEIPLLHQALTKEVIVSKSGFKTSQRDDEVPGDAITYVLHRL
ncbi:MAG: TIR domain-containing protein [Muribaculaceae bacterium]|nr:TIR domain-containing protein [Muribaculaceae bacterium]